MAEKIDHQIGVGGFKITDKEKANVMKVLDSGRLNYGEFSRKFESEFSQLHNSKFGVMTNSGTDALRMAIAALKEKYKWNDGDEVIVPALTFIATSNVVLQNNLTPVFVDVEKDYYGIDTEKIENAITDRTRAIMPVHLFGMPAQMDKIVEISKKPKTDLSIEKLSIEDKQKLVDAFAWLIQEDKKQNPAICQHKKDKNND